MISPGGKAGKMVTWVPMVRKNLVIDDGFLHLKQKFFGWWFGTFIFFPIQLGYDQP